MPSWTQSCCRHRSCANSSCSRLKATYAAFAYASLHSILSRCPFASLQVKAGAADASGLSIKWHATAINSKYRAKPEEPKQEVKGDQKQQQQG